MPIQHSTKCKVLDGDKHKYIECRYDHFETVEDLTNTLSSEEILEIVNNRLRQKAMTKARQEFYDSQESRDEQEPPTS
jgi:hypothetical protein